MFLVCTSAIIFDYFISHNVLFDMGVEHSYVGILLMRELPAARGSCELDLKAQLARILQSARPL